MKSRIATLLIIIALTTGCIQMPTTESKMVDSRPQLTFKISDKKNIEQYTVTVDGLDNGVIAPYSTGKNALRVLPGTHVIEIYKNGILFSSQKIYVGDGVTKEVIVQ